MHLQIRVMTSEGAPYIIIFTENINNSGSDGRNITLEELINSDVFKEEIYNKSGEEISGFADFQSKFKLISNNNLLKDPKMEINYQNIPGNPQLFKI